MGRRKGKKQRKEKDIGRRRRKEEALRENEKRPSSSSLPRGHMHAAGPFVCPLLHFHSFLSENGGGNVR